MHQVSSGIPLSCFSVVLWVNQKPLSKEARIYNGKKIASLTSGAGKIGQPLVKE